MLLVFDTLSESPESLYKNRLDRAGTPQPWSYRPVRLRGESNFCFSVFVPTQLYSTLQNVIMITIPNSLLMLS